jgi:signal-transduction protein with cAMP-binding, CBS, and nucleotidyltransferase domain
MTVGETCKHKVVTIRASEQLGTAARLMREEHIGYLVVVEPAAQEGELVPIGVLSDRDIVVSVVARDADPRSLCVGDIMTRKPTVALMEDTLPDALHQMRRIGVRRLPVVGDYGWLRGLLSLDDVLIKMSEELHGATGAIRKEWIVEGAQRP